MTNLDTAIDNAVASIDAAIAAHPLEARIKKLAAQLEDLEAYAGSIQRAPSVFDKYPTRFFIGRHEGSDFEYLDLGAWLKIIANERIDAFGYVEDNGLHTFFSTSRHRFFIEPIVSLEITARRPSSPSLKDVSIDELLAKVGGQ